VARLALDALRRQLRRHVPAVHVHDDQRAEGGAGQAGQLAAHQRDDAS
jgi:hypothetical protein